MIAARQQQAPRLRAQAGGAGRRAVSRRAGDGLTHTSLNTLHPPHPTPCMLARTQAAVGVWGIEVVAQTLNACFEHIPSARSRELQYRGGDRMGRCGVGGVGQQQQLQKGVR